MRFPSGDKGQVRGFDGHLVSDVKALNVPQGQSFWEISTEQDYRHKAERDFNKRAAEVSPADQQNTTFVFVSPWPPSPVKAGWVVLVGRVSCAGLEVAAGAYDVRISHIHGSLSG
jgi:hypothetical protein